MNLLGRLRDSLARTKQQIADRFDQLVRLADEPARRLRPIDAETIDALEELLISADIGVAATDRIIAAVKGASPNGRSLRDLVKQLELVRKSITPSGPASPQATGSLASNVASDIRHGGWQIPPAAPCLIS